MWVSGVVCGVCGEVVAGVWCCVWVSGVVCKGGGGGGGERKYATKNKNPTQRCGQKNNIYIYVVLFLVILVWWVQQKPNMSIQVWTVIAFVGNSLNESELKTDHLVTMENQWKSPFSMGKQSICMHVCIYIYVYI